MTLHENTQRLINGIRGGVEVAGLRTQQIRFREGTQFSLYARGPALGEIMVNGSFGLMYRRTNSTNNVKERMFHVTNSDYETLDMSHAELLEAVNKLADVAD